jgi:hypothetical protein
VHDEAVNRERSTAADATKFAELNQQIHQQASALEAAADETKKATERQKVAEERATKLEQAMHLIIGGNEVELRVTGGGVSKIVKKMAKWQEQQESLERDVEDLKRRENEAKVQLQEEVKRCTKLEQERGDEREEQKRTDAELDEQKLRVTELTIELEETKEDHAKALKKKTSARKKFTEKVQSLGNIDTMEQLLTGLLGKRTAKKVMDSSGSLAFGKNKPHLGDRRAIDASKVMLAVMEGANQLLFAQAKDPTLASGDAWAKLTRCDGFLELAGEAAAEESRELETGYNLAKAYQEVISESLERLHEMQKYDTKYKRAFFQLLAVVSQRKVMSIPCVLKEFRYVCTLAVHSLQYHICRYVSACRLMSLRHPSRPPFLSCIIQPLTMLSFIIRCLQHQEDDNHNLHGAACTGGDTRDVPWCANREGEALAQQV